MLPRVIKGVNLLPKQTITERPEEKSPSKQPPVTEPSSPAEPVSPEKKQEPPSSKPPEKPPAPKPPEAETKQEVSSSSPKPEEKPVSEKPAEQKPPQQQTQPSSPVSPPAAQQQPATPSPQQPAVQQNPPPAVKPPETEKTVETRDAGIYFIQEKGGSAGLTLVKVNRKIKVSASPLQDSINALLAGPSAEEKNRGIISCIPEGSRLISAFTRGTTAYLDFNEEFRYNPFGREDAAAQFRHIVWTATEFYTVRDVQILIEGKPVDFLSEGVMIGSPIGR
jgi:spore germination protein GerM